MVRVVSSVVVNQVVSVYSYDASEWYGPPEIEEQVEPTEEMVWIPTKVTSGKEML